MGLPTDPYKWGDQKKTIQERMQGFDVKPNPAQPEDTTPPPGTPPNPEQIQTPEGAVDDAMAPTYGEPRQKTPDELLQNPAQVAAEGVNPDAVDPSLAGGVPQQGDQPQPGAPGAQPGKCPACGQPLKAQGADKAQMAMGVSEHECPARMAKVEVRGQDADIVYQAPKGYFVVWKEKGRGKIEGPFDTIAEAKQHVAASGKELSEGEEEMSKDVNKAALAEFGAVKRMAQWTKTDYQDAQKQLSDLNRAADGLENAEWMPEGAWRAHVRKAQASLNEACRLLDAEIRKYDE